MTPQEKDAAELAWWRSAFATRFAPDSLPKVGTALYGMRLRVVDVGGREIDAHGQAKGARPRDSGRGTLNLGAAAEIVGVLGAGLEKRGGGGWASVKALVYLVGCEDWNAAAQLADALGVHPDDQHAIFHQTLREKAKP